MGTIFTIISALLPFVVEELQQYKVVSPQLATLIDGIAGASTAFEGTITASPVTAASILAAISASLTVLQSQTTIDPKVLSMISAVDKAIQAGINASAVTAVDPSKLSSIVTIA